MKRLVSNKRGEVSYGPKWQNTESSSDSENDEGYLLSHTIATAQEDNEDHIPNVKKRVEVTVKDGDLMYIAALKGDWVAAEVLLDRDRSLAIDYITEEGDRALHVAAAMKQEEFAKKLVERMRDEELALRDGHGYTACCYAAISNSGEIVCALLNRNRHLGAVPDEENATPLRKAALRGRQTMLELLLLYTSGIYSSAEEWFDLLLVTIRNQMFDVAVEIIGKNESIATMANEEGTALHQLARIDASRIIYDTSEFVVSAGHTLNSRIKYDASEFVGLAKKLWDEMLKMEKASLMELMKKPVHIIHEAAKAGQVEIITMLSRSFPKLIWETDRNGYTIFHSAVMYQRTAVFGLVHQVEPMLGLRTIWQDGQGNNILHLAAARSAAVTKPKLQPPLELQRELKWFRAVIEIVPPSCLMMRNGQGLTPEELFSKTHKKLLKESETWMINKAESLMLIATILLTVVFAAAFAVPGGYSSQTGEPVLAKNRWFKAFIIFEILSLFSSMFSIIIFQSIVASRFAQEEFLVQLPVLQRTGFQSLLMSLFSTFLAFMASIMSFNMDRTRGMLWFCFACLCLYGSIWAIRDLTSAYRHTSDITSHGKDRWWKNIIMICSVKLGKELAQDKIFPP